MAQSNHLALLNPEMCGRPFGSTSRKRTSVRKSPFPVHFAKMFSTVVPEDSWDVRLAPLLQLQGSFVRAGAGVQRGLHLLSPPLGGGLLPDWPQAPRLPLQSLSLFEGLLGPVCTLSDAGVAEGSSSESPAS